MGGFGGVLKNQSIGIATPEGKTLIHTAGVYSEPRYVFQQPHGQDGFLESMAAAAQAVHNYFKRNAIYINVMNNLSSQQQVITVLPLYSVLTADMVPIS